MLAFGVEGGCEPVPRTGAASAEADSNALCLELTPGRTRVQLGEPVIAAVSLRNCSKEPTQVEDLLAPEYGFLQVSLSPPGGGPLLRWRPVVRREARGKRPRNLAPGQSLSAWIPLYAGADGWMLDRPGRYEVNAEYAVEGVRVSATPVAIEVEASAAPEERAAAGLLMNEAAALFLLTGHDKGERGSKSLSLLLRDHPQGPLTPYAQTALGIGRMQERFDPAQKAFRTADCQGAVELLKPAVRRVADPFLAAIGTRSLAQCLRALGRAAEAEEAIQGYSRSHPGGRELPGVLEALQGTDGRQP